MTVVVLETERLYVRHLSFDDAAFILRLLNEPSFLEHIGDRNIRTLDDSKAYIKRGPMQSHEKHGFGLDCVELKESKKPIGICGLLQRPGLVDVDIGYAFLPQFWSKGYALEAASGVLSHAKKNLGMKRIAAIVNQDNSNSICLLEKLNFRYTRMVSPPQGKKEVKLYTAIL